MSLAAILGSLAVGAAGSMAEGGISNFFGGQNAKRNFKYWQKMADIQQFKQSQTMDKQYRLQNEFVDKQNMYNLPQNVVARYRQAGINPLAAFGGLAVGQSASNLPSLTAGSSYGGVSPSDPHITGPLQNAMMLAQHEVDLGNLDVNRSNVDGLNLLRESESALNYAKTLVSGQERENLKQLHDFLALKNPIEIETAQQALDNARELKKEIQSKVALNDQERKNKAAALEGIETANAIASVQLATAKETSLRKANAEIAEIYANVRYLDAKTAESEQNKDNAYIDMLMKPVKLNLDYVNTFVTAAEAFSGISLDSAQRDEIIKKTKNIDVENGFKAVDLFIDAWDTFVNSSKDRESRDKNASEKSKSDARNALSGILRTALFAIITKGK